MVVFKFKIQKKVKKTKKKRRKQKIKEPEKLVNIWLQDGTDLQKLFLVVFNMIQKLMFGVLAAL